MFSKQDLKNYLEEISESAQFIKFNFVSTEKFIVQLKCTVASDESANYYNNYVLEWIKKFSTFTATTWIVRNSFPRLKRLLYRKLYICHRSSFNKKKLTTSDTLNQECRAKIDFKMKFINRNTMKNDPYLKEGLNLTITIEFLHTHKIRTAEALNLLKSTPDTDDVFYNYLSTGYTPTAAKAYHELILTDRYGDTSEYLLKGNINPTMRHILYLHRKVKSNTENPPFEQLMTSRKAALEAAGGSITYDNPNIVIIITAIMKRTLSGFELDHIFIDSTATCNGLIVTFLYMLSKAGALPIVCILHTEKEATNYSQVLLTSKLSLENNINKNFEPKIIIIKDCIEIREAAAAIFPNSSVVSSHWSIRERIWRWIFCEDIKIEWHKRHSLMELFDSMIRTVTDAEKYYLKLKDEWPSLTEYIEDLWQKRDQWLHHLGPYMNLMEASIRVMDEFVQQKCKAFNIYVMVDVVSNIIESQIQHILLAHAKKSQNIPAAYTRHLSDKKSILNFELHVKKINSREFRIETNNIKAKFAKFRTDTWCCDCGIGRRGRFCEHLYLIINVIETDLLRSAELTDEEKCLFTNIAGVEETSIKPEIIETINSDDEDMADMSKMDECPEPSPKSKTDDNYFYLEVKSEHSEGNDPLEDNMNEGDKPVDTIQDNFEENNTRKTFECTSTGDSKQQYEIAMKTLNNEFRRLNKHFKENPNTSNLETMLRLAKELGKIRPIEKVNFSGLNVTLNNTL
jgi:hypothetical protein